MPYGYIVIAGVMALTLYYAIATEASLISKVLVVGMAGFCLACLFWWHRFSLAALFIMVGLGVFISLYRIYAQSRSSDR